jgi:hypothetical protein
MHLDQNAITAANPKVDEIVLAHIQRLQDSLPMGTEKPLGANYHLTAPLGSPPSAILRQRSEV